MNRRPTMILLSPSDVVRFYVSQGFKFDIGKWDFLNYDYYLDKERNEIITVERPTRKKVKREEKKSIEDTKENRQRLKAKLTKYLTENPDKVDEVVDKYNKVGIQWQIDVLNEVLGELNEDVPF